MKYFISLVLTIALSTAFYAQNAKNNGLIKLKKSANSTTISEFNYVKSNIPVATPSQLAGSYPIAPKPAPNKSATTNNLLNLGNPFTYLNGPKLTKQNNSKGNGKINTPNKITVNNSKNSTNPRNLPLNSKGNLISPDGYEVTFKVPQTSKNSDICSTPIPVMVDGNKNPACGYIVPEDNAAVRDAANTTTVKYFQLRWLVFTDGGPSSNIDQTRINALMAELNADYAAHNMVFCADPATFLESPTWYTHNSNTDEFPMKDANNVNPTQVINIYVVGTMASGGYARMPYDPSGGTNARGGIVLNRGNCSLGTHTLAHEMGHTFGLFHTFNGVSEQSTCGNCYEQVRNVNGSSNTTGVPTPLGGPYTNEGDREGDWCSDTNPHAQDSYQCPGPADSEACDAFPRVPANYPVDNHMSYSFCSSTFTAQQGRRMHVMVDRYLSSWVAYGGGICGALPPTADFVGTPTTWQSPSTVTFTDLSQPTAIIDSVYWEFNSTGQAGTVTPLTFSSTTGANPPNVVYDIGASASCLDYEVTLTVFGPNGSDVEVKTNYITVCPGAGDCDTLDFQWTTPAPTIITYGFGGGWISGVPDPVNMVLPTDPKGVYEGYFSPNPGVTKVGAIRVALGSLFDPNDDMTFQVTVYDDDGAGAPGALLGGRGGISPTQLGVPGAGFYNETWIPLFTPLVPTTAFFHVGVEIFAGGASDTLVVMTSCLGPPGCPVAQGETDASNHIWTSGFGYENFLTVYGADFDAAIIPMLGEYSPLPTVQYYDEIVNCDTTYVTIYDTVLYTDYSNSDITGMSYTFADGTTINTTSPLGNIPRTYTSTGPDTLTITAINSCGRADTTSWIIPYNFTPTPDAEFTKVQANPICAGAPGVDFNANVSGYQDYTWDFGDGTVLSSGNSPTVNHVYGTPGLYYTTLTVTSLGYQPIDTFYLENFESGWPAGYDRYNNDAFTPNAGVNPPFTGSNATAWLPIDADGDGNTEAVSTSWNSGAGQQADDWMLTTGIGPLPANQMLTWDAEAANAVFADGYEVRISTTQLPANTTNYSTVLTTVTAENAFRTTRSVDLSSYAGQTVFIAFRNNSTDEFLLYIDNIRVGTIGPGCTNTLNKTDFVEIIDCTVIPPVADINASDSTGCAPLTVTFTDATVIGDPATSWLWNFGDGNFSTAQNPPPHLYSIAGTYFVSFEACNAGGCTTDYITINVGNVVTSNAGIDQDICGGTTATLAGNDPSPYSGMWSLISGSGSPTTPAAFNSGVTGLAVGTNEFAWTITGTAGCTSADTVAITITAPPNAGTDNTLTACSSDGTTNLITLIGTPDAGGIWIGPSALANGDQGTFDPATNAAGTYQYVVTGTAPCANDTADVVVTINAAPNAGTDNTLTACSSDGTTNLITLIGTPDAGGIWIGPSALANGDQGTFDPATNAAGTYQYVVTGTAPCANDTADVVVTINTAPNAGADNTLTACSSDGTTDLITLIGTPDAGGTWIGPSVLANGDQGTFDPATNTAGTYQYVVTGTAPCANDTADVVITINAAANAGTDNTLTACSSDGTTNLITLIGTPDAGGIWIGPSALANGDQGTFDPATNAAGTYQYVVTGTAPCANDTADVVVTINAAPNAGTDNTLTACSSDGTTDLITLIGTPDAGGTWIGPSALANGDQGTFDPATNTAGTYQYVVTGTAPCANDTADVVVTINAAPNAGTDNNFGICASASATDLFNLLGAADNSGIWIGPSALANGNQGTFDPATNAAGTYQYIVTGTAPCANDTADIVVTITANDDPTFVYPDICEGSGGLPGVINTPGGTFSFNPDPADGATINPTTGAIANEVGGSTYNIQYLTPAGACQDSVTISVNIVTPANAGADNTLTACSSDGTTNLITLIGTPDAGGTWIGPSVLANGDQGTFDPATNTAGTYQYVVTGTAPCSNDTADVVITINAAANAGADNTLTACSSDGTTDLITLIGTPDAGGTWIGPSALANGDQGTFDPATNTAGTYQYVVTGTAPCANDTADVVVTINAAPNAGTDNNFGICASASATDLFNLLGAADNSGIWIGPSALANGNQGTFDPATNAAGTYQYIVTGTAPCANDTADIVVTITANDDPTFVYPDICEGSGGLPGVINTPGGTFSFNPDPADGATINPTTGAIANEVGGSTYNIQYLTPAGPCQDSVTISVNIVTPANAGSDNNLSICTSSPATDLFNLLGAADNGGIWIGPSALANGDQGTFDPATNTAGTYQYVVTGTAPCANDTADVVVTITTNDDPTFTYPDICEGSGGLPGVINTPGGTFSFNPDPADGATINPTTGAIANEVGGSTYNIQYLTPAGPCQDSVTISINIVSPVNAGSDNSLSICTSSPATDLFNLLGAADNGGTWIGPSALANGDQGTFDPATNAAGTYQYVVTGTAPCANDTADVVVTITTNDDPTFTYPDICEGSGGLPGVINTPGGTFSFNPDPADGATINPTTGAIANEVGGSTYNIQYLTPAGPCQDSVTISINIVSPANAGTSASTTVCDTDPAFDLFNLLGSADIGGSWSPSLNSGTGVFDPSIDIAGIYTYTVTGVSPCGNSNASVTVIVDNCDTIPTPTTFVISNMMTPNNDGKNDTWIITNVSLLEGSPVMIYNRWGTKLYETTSYDNSWDGSYNGQDLPDGTYYYVIEHNGEVIQGPLTILRNK